MKFTAPLKILLAASLLLPFSAGRSWAATGCDLNNADSDVPRLFPGSTSYKSSYLSLMDHELNSVVARLGGDNFRGLYDPLNVPYTLYEVFNGTKKVGYVHGVNQKGQFGGIQVFVSLDMKGVVKAFYIQKITGRTAAKFRDADFGKQFIGVSLRDFDSYDPATGKGSGRMAQIRNPAPEALTDFYGILRALKKNLILMDELVYSSKRKVP